MNEKIQNKEYYCSRCVPVLHLLCLEENEKGESALSQYREQATTSSALAARLSEEVSRLTTDRDDLKRHLCVARYDNGTDSREITIWNTLRLKKHNFIESFNTVSCL
jgi:hypothetical protein